MDLDTFMSGDRVVFSFVMAWVACGVVWLALDWLGNSNRGSFRPKSEQQFGTRKERRDERLLKRAENDAAVRSTLRDAYGASSLRVIWTKRREGETINADEALIRVSPLAPRRRRRRGRIPELDEEILTPQVEGLLPTYDEAHPPKLEMPPRQGRWKTGEDPLMHNRRGAAPTAATLRSRVWKNCAGDTVWGEANQDRMRSGKPPRRHNPVSGRIETASVDLTTAIPMWKSVAIDPFAVLAEDDS